MKILDCENLASTRSSLESILGITEVTLWELFDSHPHIEDELADNASHWDASGINMPSQLLFYHLQKDVGCEACIDSIYWFHCTRSEPGVKLYDGLLPRSMVENKIWDILYSYVQDELSVEKWKALRESLSASSIGVRLVPCYYLKSKRPDIHDGPYAYLVRDVPIEIHNNRDNTYVDYFETPEMVEEICEVCEQMFQIDLLSRFRAQTRPCIVKFRHMPSSDIATKILSGALLYAYHKHYSCSLDGAYYLLDAKGTPVKSDHVESIDWLNDL